MRESYSPSLNSAVGTKTQNLSSTLQRTLKLQVFNLFIQHEITQYELHIFLLIMNMNYNIVTTLTHAFQCMKHKRIIQFNMSIQYPFSIQNILFAKAFIRVYESTES